ncbi:glycosyltransferase [Kineococcus rubinsiae]|uniref:glycosyltransferase n=1 Tax=Kineococcus rubinsiae TaxID=2609562 RepID=UPI00143144FB|nr:glycosyltransferase [Kineococcus rubinsiae]NIZ93279.1 glycosyltransferase family 4 protein [Kineococcus rubinsiae]
MRTLEALPGVRRHVVLGEDGPLVPLLLAAGATVEVLPLSGDVRNTSRTEASRVPLAGLVATATYTLRLARRLRTLRPDAVHTNSLKSAVYGSLAARLAGVPVVWHARDRIADDYMPARTAAVVRQLARRLPTVVLANSQATATTLQLPARRPAVVVPDPYLPKHAPQDRTDVGPVRFVMVGRLAPWKGQHVFLAAFARALAGTPHRAVVLGSALFGEDDYAEQVRRQVEDLGLTGQVELRGFSDDVEGVLAASDVLVHASTVPEPFGQVVVEGMAAGLTVLAADAGGPAEIVTHDHDGLLYPVGDVEALARLLAAVAADPGLRARLGEAAVATAAQYRPEALGPRFAAVYAAVGG